MLEVCPQLIGEVFFLLHEYRPFCCKRSDRERSSRITEVCYNRMAGSSVWSTRYTPYWRRMIDPIISRPLVKFHAVPWESSGNLQTAKGQICPSEKSYRYYLIYSFGICDSFSLLSAYLWVLISHQDFFIVRDSLSLHGLSSCVLLGSMKKSLTPMLYLLWTLIHILSTGQNLSF